MRKEGVEQHKADGRGEQGQRPSPVSINGPGDKGGGEEETARQGRVEVPPEGEGLGEGLRSGLTMGVN